MERTWPLICLFQIDVFTGLHSDVPFALKRSAELAWLRLARYDIGCARLVVRVDFLAGMVAFFDPTPLRDKVNVFR
jgi:hypothetical protein